MATQSYLEEKLATNARVYVDGQEVKFVSMILDQAFGQHHTFCVEMDYDSMKQDFMSNPLEQMKLIGRFVDIDLQQGKDGANAYEFRGVISDVSNRGQEGKHGHLIIKGYSMTALLERGERMDVFSNMDLTRVFEEVTDGIINKELSCSNKPVYNGVISFLMQYKESDWQFLQRLSAISGETLFYTGMDLVFGKYKDWKPMEVTYDKEITEFQFGSRLLPNNFTRYQYQPSLDDTMMQDAPSRIEDSDDYLNTAAARSKELTEKRPVRKPLDIAVDDKGSLDELVVREKTATAAQTVYISGTAKTCAPRIGRLLTISMPGNMSSAKDLGTYRIIKVRHIIDQGSRYKCTFEGIPADLKFFPVPDVKIPVADSLLGLVVKNNDPQGQGRVCVEFPFARDRVSETWMRVMTLNAGSSDAVGQNRGMVFVPEVGDQVMVGFEFGDPNRPYVMGSMFHGNNSKGGGANNAIKSIFTRSGIQIVFNDDEKSLHIEDPSGNTFDMDGNGNIAVNAPKNMTITVGEDLDVTVGKSILVKAGESITIDAKKDIDETAGGDINQSAVGSYTEVANNKTEIVKEEFQRSSQKSTLQAQSVTILSAKENMLLQSGKTVELNSAEKTNMY